MAGPQVAIVGSRAYPDLARVRAFVQRLAARYPEAVVLSGAARGVDRAAAEAAREAGLQVRELPAQWREGGAFNRGAGHKRNAAIVAACEVLVAFWDGQSAGTAGTIAMARRAGRRVVVYRGSFDERGNRVR